MPTYSIAMQYKYGILWVNKLVAIPFIDTLTGMATLAYTSHKLEDENPISNYCLTTLSLSKFTQTHFYNEIITGNHKLDMNSCS